MINNSTPIHNDLVNTDFNSIVLNDNFIVNKHEEAILPCELNDPHLSVVPDETLLLEGNPTSANNYNVQIARLIVSAKSCGIPIVVAYTSDNNIMIPKGTTVATITKMQYNKQVLFAVGRDLQPLRDHNEGATKAIDRISCELDSREKEDVSKIIRSFTDVFSCGPHDIGRTAVVKHEIDIGDNKPIKLPPRRLPEAERTIVNKKINDMVPTGVASPSISPFVAPLVVVMKKDGDARLCVDFRKLNAITRKDAHPLPRIDDLLDTLHGSKYFSTLDLASGYWQVEVKQEDKEKTAFVTHSGLYEFNVMPFGLVNAPATFQRLMTIVFSGLLGKFCLTYIDDNIIFSKTFQDHNEKLRVVLKRLQDAKLKVKPEKCKFAYTSVLFLGHVVNNKGISPDPSKTDKILKWPTPKSVNEVRSFLGVSNYYRRFIKNY